VRGISSSAVRRRPLTLQRVDSCAQALGSASQSRSVEATHSWRSMRSWRPRAPSPTSLRPPRDGRFISSCSCLLPHLRPRRLRLQFRAQRRATFIPYPTSNCLCAGTIGRHSDRRQAGCSEGAPRLRAHISAKRPVIHHSSAVALPDLTSNVLGSMIAMSNKLGLAELTMVPSIHRLDAPAPDDAMTPDAGSSKSLRTIPVHGLS
jgi:hypothetical protein